ncbi:hypothetical protein [Neobacillus vireti]|uniref:hypothetical protein n=1 Tax=Neobacillus vireti TaxID=220686 RepID=UPI002FFD974D
MLRKHKNRPCALYKKSRKEKQLKWAMPLKSKGFNNRRKADFNVIFQRPIESPSNQLTFLLSITITTQYSVNMDN